MDKFDILCVDDNPANLYAYEALLSKLDNINALRVESGEEALKTLLRNKVDLILLDVQMPKMDGYEVASLIKSNPSTQETPIIFITAVFKEEEFIAKGFELGAIDYVTKPIDDNLLLNKIRLYLNIFSQKRNAESNLKMFYDITHGIGNGVYVLNSKGELVFINDVALDMLGYSREELIGKLAHDAIHPYDKFMKKVAVDKCPIHGVFQTKATTKLDEDVLLKKDGALLPVATIATPIVKNDAASEVVCVFRDATQEISLRHMNEEKIRSQNEMLFMLMESLDKRDPYTAGHTKRVASYCGLIAKTMGCSQEEIDLLINAAYLHDVGKIFTPDAILLKPGNFDSNEFEIMKLHLEHGHELIKNVKDYSKVAEVMRYHHERFNGKGYPLGLSGNAIPPLARIMIVADSFDAMTTNRIYKKRKSVEEALEEIIALKEVQFHPEVVDAAIIAFKDLVISENRDQQPHSLLEEKRFSYFYIDQLTGLYNVKYIPSVLDTYFFEKEVALHKINLHNMSQYNAKHGWEQGDILLKSFTEFLRKECPHRFVFRVSGDDFLIISEEECMLDEGRVNQFLANIDPILHVSAWKTRDENKEKNHEALFQKIFD